MPRRFAAELSISLAALAILTGLLSTVRDIANHTTIALFYLLLVLFGAAFAQFATAIMLSVASVIVINFFFFPPVGTFTLEDPNNWVALGVFLVVAIVSSHLATTVRSGALSRQRAELSSALLQSMSHDLRTPLTAIRVSVGNLAESDLTDDERQEQALVAREQLEQLSRVVDDVLDMARIETGVLQVEREWVTPAQVVEAALASRASLLRDRTVTVEADDQTAIELDPRLTSMALAHLLENASQYSPRETRIAVHAGVQGECFQASVTDGGPGVDANDLDRIFEPFYRGRSSRGRSIGSGMGLAITRGLLAPQHGRVWAENAPPHGARFTIAIPAAVRVLEIIEQ